MDTSQESRLQFRNENEKSEVGECDEVSHIRRSSILKPPKVRGPLLDVNFVTKNTSEDFETTRKRKVSFAGVNKVREFNSKAGTIHVSNTPSYDELFSTSSDSSEMSLSESCGNSLRSKDAITEDEAKAVIANISNDDSILLSESMDITDCCSNDDLVDAENHVGNLNHEFEIKNVESGFIQISKESKEQKESEDKIDAVFVEKTNFQVFINPFTSQFCQTFDNDELEETVCISTKVPLSKTHEVISSYNKEENIPQCSDAMVQNNSKREKVSPDSDIINNLSELKANKNNKSDAIFLNTSETEMDFTQAVVLNKTSEAVLDMSQDSSIVDRIQMSTHLSYGNDLKKSFENHSQITNNRDAKAHSGVDNNVVQSISLTLGVPKTEILEKSGNEPVVTCIDLWKPDKLQLNGAQGNRMVAEALASLNYSKCAAELNDSSAMEFTEALSVSTKCDDRNLTLKITAAADFKVQGSHDVELVGNCNNLDDSSDMEITEPCALNELKTNAHRNTELPTDWFIKSSKNKLNQDNLLISDGSSNQRSKEEKAMNSLAKTDSERVSVIVDPDKSPTITTARLTEKSKGAHGFNVPNADCSNMEFTEVCSARPFVQNLASSHFVPDLRSEKTILPVSSNKDTLQENNQDNEFSLNMELTNVCELTQSVKTNRTVGDDELSCNMDLTGANEIDHPEEVNKALNNGHELLSHLEVNQPNALKPSVENLTHPSMSTPEGGCSSNMKFTEACVANPLEKMRSSMSRNIPLTECSSNMSFTEACVGNPLEKMRSSISKNILNTECSSNMSFTEACVANPLEKMRSSISKNILNAECSSNMSFTEACVAIPLEKMRSSILKNIPNTECSSNMEFTEACFANPLENLRSSLSKNIPSNECTSNMEFTEACVAKPLGKMSSSMSKNIPTTECSSNMEFTACLIRPSVEASSTSHFKDLQHLESTMEFTEACVVKLGGEKSKVDHSNDSFPINEISVHEKVVEMFENEFSLIDMEITTSLNEQDAKSKKLGEVQLFADADFGGSLNVAAPARDENSFKSNGGTNVPVSPVKNLCRERENIFSNIRNQDNLKEEVVDQNRKSLSLNNEMCQNLALRQPIISARLDSTDMEITEVYDNLPKNKVEKSKTCEVQGSEAVSTVSSDEYFISENNHENDSVKMDLTFGCNASHKNTVDNPISIDANKVDVADGNKFITNDLIKESENDKSTEFRNTVSNKIISDNLLSENVSTSAQNLMEEDNKPLDMAKVEATLKISETDTYESTIVVDNNSQKLHQQDQNASPKLESAHVEETEVHLIENICDNDTTNKEEMRNSEDNPVTLLRLQDQTSAFHSDDPKPNFYSTIMNGKSEEHQFVQNVCDDRDNIQEENGFTDHTFNEDSAEKNDAAKAVSVLSEIKLNQEGNEGVISKKATVQKICTTFKEIRNEENSNEKGETKNNLDLDNSALPELSKQHGVANTASDLISHSVVLSSIDGINHPSGNLINQQKDPSESSSSVVNETIPSQIIDKGYMINVSGTESKNSSRIRSTSYVITDSKDRTTFQNELSFHHLMTNEHHRNRKCIQEFENNDFVQSSINIKNLKFMENLNFFRVGETEWQYILTDILTIRFDVPFEILTESTKVKNVYYKISNTKAGAVQLYIAECITERFNEDWLKSVCFTINDLQQTISIITRDRCQIKKFYNTLNYLYSFYPCKLRKNSISFYIVDIRARMKFDVIISINGWSKITCNDIKVINEVGTIRENFVRSIFNSINDDEKKLLNFVRFLEKYCQTQIHT